MVLSVSVVHPRDCMADGSVAHCSLLPLPDITGGHPDRSTQASGVLFLFCVSDMLLFKEGDDCAVLESTRIKRSLEICRAYVGLGV